jgi:hypothetical protein
MIFCIPIRVDCYSGYRADETPRALSWGGRRLAVLEVLDRWYQGEVDPQAPSADYFKVLTEDGKRHIIKHERVSHVWCLVSEEP